MVQLTHNGLIFNDFGLYVPIIPIVCIMSPAKGHGIQEVSGSIPLSSTKTSLRGIRMKIFHNAIIYIGDGFTSAFAVEGGRFAAVGADALALEDEQVW